MRALHPRYSLIILSMCTSAPRNDQAANTKRQFISPSKIKPILTLFNCSVINVVYKNTDLSLSRQCAGHFRYMYFDFPTLRWTQHGVPTLIQNPAGISPSRRSHFTIYLSPSRRNMSVYHNNNSNCFGRPPRHVNLYTTSIGFFNFETVMSGGDSTLSL